MISEEIFYARGKNWIRLIVDKIKRMEDERKDDPSLMVDILNGALFERAQEEFAIEKQQGKWDAMCMPAELNL